MGNLLDRTYFGNPNLDIPFGLAFAQDHSVLLGAFQNNSGAYYGVTVLAQLNFGDGVEAPAACLSPDVLNAASFSPGVAPGSAITLTGFGMGPQAGVVAQAESDGALPTQLSGVQVLFDGQPAPLLYVQSQQINAFAPFTLTGATTNLTVTYNGATIGSAPAPVVAQATSLFRLSPLSTQLAAINQDGTVNGPSHPAPVGSVISLYATGCGQTQIPGVAGTIFPDTASSLVTPVAVYVGGMPADVLYAGAAPLEFAGIDQINVRIPAGLPPGAAEVCAAPLIYGVQSPCTEFAGGTGGATITVQ
jgi:uncharacterized protein (TIGR03437 family)